MAISYVINTGEPKELTEDEIMAIKPVLEGIRDGFTPDIFETQVTTQYITATYNQQNPTATIDGVTVEMILAYQSPSTGV